jgi:uncharacterized protein
VVRRIPLERTRRIALAAQGFATPRPTGRTDVRHFRRVVDAVRIVQLDSVNVVSRAHYLPFFARLGPYDRAALDRWLWRSGEMFEYWVHEASLVPTGHRPLVVHRMEGAKHWSAMDRIQLERPGFLEEVLSAVRERGPLKVGDLDGHRRADSWWGWGDAKIAIERLFLTGKVTAADRPGFQRIYDLPERVHPHAVELGGLEADDAKTEMLAHGAAAHGIGTVHDIADYYRLNIGDARRLMPRLIARGEVEEVEVPGWAQPAYLHTAAAHPRSISASALLAPFDPVVWFRDRGERLFDFFYRIEIYTPEPKRVYGYYVLPFLLDDRLVARVDLKADRKARRLLVRSAFGEDGVEPDHVTAQLAEELAAMASWLDLDEIEVGDRGDLIQPLRRQLG